MKAFLTLFLITGIFLSSTQTYAQSNNSDTEAEIESSTPKRKLSKKKRAQVGEMQDEDLDQLERRIRARDFWSFSFGPSYLSDPKEDISDKMLYGASFARHWEVSSLGEIRARLAGAGGSSGSAFSGGLGGAWLPIRTEISPLLGGEFGVGRISGKEAQSGFTAGIYGGVRLFRLSDIQMEIVAGNQSLLVKDSQSTTYFQIGVLY